MVGTNLDLVVQPTPKQYGWLNVFKNDDGSLRCSNTIYHSKDIADGSPIASDRAGCIRVELAERWDE